MSLGRDYGRKRQRHKRWRLESGDTGRAIEEKKSIGGKVLERDRKRSNSCGMVKEVMKRKRESVEKGDKLFKKSNKTQRTPESVGKAEGGRGNAEKVER